MGRRRGKRNNTLKRQPASRPLPSYEEEIISSFKSMTLGSTGPGIRFEDLKLSAGMLKGIHSYGLERPSPIQERAIPPIIKGRDVILQAQSGMGKTAAFCIGILERIEVENPNIQAIVLTPTRELAIQTFDVFDDLAGSSEIGIIVFIGGTNLKKDRRELEDYYYHIAVGTLGRILNLINENLIDLSTVNILVLDEADKMITEKSFVSGLKRIINVIPGDAQIITASATMPLEAVELTKSIMRNPVRFLVNKEELTLEGIKQFYVNVDDDQEKVETLRDLYPAFSKHHTVIFCSTRKKVKWLSEVLVGDNIGKITSMTGDRRQNEREVALQNFRTGKIRVMITSDLLGRGVDVQQLRNVINFDLPMKNVDYIHRVGRGGRFGRKGVAISLVTAKELERLNGIAEFYQTDIRELGTDLKNVF